MNAIWKFIAHPMVALSLALHVVLLLLPMPSATQSEPDPEEPPEEEVTLSSISSLKVSPQPTPTPKVVPPTPTPIVKPPIKAAVPQPRPPAPTPQPTPVASPTPAATPSPTPAATPSPIAASPSPSPPLEPNPLQGNFALGAGQASAAQFYSYFPEPTAFFDAVSIQQAEASQASGAPVDPVPVEGVTNMTRIELKNVAQVREEFLPQAYPGATFTQIGSYGGGDLYEVRQGDSVGYVVLVKENSISLATFVVEWNRNPNLPSQTATTPNTVPLQ